MRGYYENATICLNGHVASSHVSNYIKFCKICGESTISNCLKCEFPIEGSYRNRDIIDFTPYDPPNYCHECGTAYPWTEKIFNNIIELVSLDDELSQEHRTIIKNAIPDLIIDSPTTPLAQAKYKKYMSQAAEYVQEGARNLLIDVVSEAVKKSLFS